MLLHSERRQREQNAAWEKMESKDRVREVQTGEARADAEAFVTESYRKQLEINKESVLVQGVEERANERKTANSETGMMGFYKNLMTRNSAVGANVAV